MTFNRLETDREDIGNLLVSMPFSDQLDHGLLARRQNVRFWERRQPPPIGSGLIFVENNKGKYRGEPQKWVKNNDDIINKRRFHKGF